MAESQKCACKDCVCMVSADKAVTEDGQLFCCDACASGHAEKDGCDHGGCNCHG